MCTGMFSKLALATVAAVFLYVPTLGLPLPLNSCLPASGVATAAPLDAAAEACVSDLKDCLSGATQTGLRDVRYIAPEDVDRCVHDFNDCWDDYIYAVLNPSTSTPSPSTSSSPASTSSPEGANTPGMPPRFKITANETFADCTARGEAVTCTLGWDAPDWVDAFTGSFAGTLSGWAATGTATSHIEGHSPADSSCTHVEDYSGPATYIFSPNGSVTMRVGPNQRQTTATCNGRQTSNSGVTDGVGEVTGVWVAVK